MEIRARGGRYSVVVAPPENRTAQGAKDPEDHSDDDQEDAERHQDADVDQRPDNRDDETENNHDLPPCSVSPCLLPTGPGGETPSAAAVGIGVNLKFQPQWRP
jgi:hypothetical protein